jgi:sigma-B regulation protein RsbU (phosphoserine phosphatase)
MGIVFMGIFCFQLLVLQNMMKTEEESQSNLIQDRFGTAMTDNTEQDLMSLINWAADYTDDEFRTLDHDLRILRQQVEDVFRHPERYGKIQISAPRMENAGKPALQLIASEGYENINPKTYEMMQRLANLEPMMTEMSGTDYGAIESLICTPDGVTLVVDSVSDRKFDENGKIKAFDPTARPWFQGAVDADDIFFSSIDKSQFSGHSEMEYSMPVYVDDRLVAVIEGAVELDGIINLIKERDIGKSGFSVLVSKDGCLEATYRTFGELKEPEDTSIDIRNTVNPELKHIINEALDNKFGVSRLKVDGENYYAAYGPVATCGWAQIMFVSVDEIMDPANDLLEEMRESSQKTVDDQNARFTRSIIGAILMLIALVVSAIVIISKTSTKEVEPITKLAESMREMGGVNMFFEMEDIYKTGDEIQDLAESFGALTEKMRNYVDEIMEIMMAKERVKTELALATRIQSDMLPSIFPAFPERTEFNIYASMTPAKEVGGDFYDFFFVGEDYLAMVIADVSGKGIPAAMFMMMAKCIIQTQVIACRDPHTVLEDVNNIIYANNKEKMFVTVWVGILDINTGLIVASNAAHEYPFLKEPDSKFEKIEEPHGIMLGLRKNRKHTNYEIQMKPGSKLFVYTDGVPEAMDTDGELFGMDRLLSALNDAADSTPEEILGNVDREVREFMGNAEQFDDLTMLCIEYHGKEE